MSTDSTLSRKSFVGGVALGALLGGAGVAWWRGGLERDLQHYREVRDWARGAFVKDLGSDELLDHALHGLADGLDPYSAYYNRAETVQLERETVGRFSGMGIVLKRPFRDGRVLFALDGSPAQAAGVRVGDRIVRVNARAFAELDEAAFRAEVQDAEPHDVALVLAGLDGVERELVVRTESVIEPTIKHERIVDAVEGAAYLAIRSFTRETAREFDLAFERLLSEGMRALVIDLRGNPGGVLQAAVDIVRRFQAEGVIVSTEGRGEVVQHVAEPTRALWQGFPLVLLVDDESASASEVLAAALQEYRAAVLIGSATFGKGMVQTIHSFEELGSALKVTTSYYYTPSHQNLEHSFDPSAPRGIAPDLWLALPSAERRSLHEYLARPSPSAATLAELRSWEAREGLQLIEPEPADPQLAAALALLAGGRPGPYALDNAP